MSNKDLISVDGFITAYMENCLWATSCKEAYLATEKEYQQIHKTGRRYSSYDSFRNVKNRILRSSSLNRRITKKPIAMEQNENTKIVVITINELRDIIREEFVAIIKEHLADQNDRFLKRSEAAEYLRVTLPTIDKLFQSGELNKYKVSGRILVKASELKQLARKPI